jgi:hypothetical protein
MSKQDQDVITELTPDQEARLSEFRDKWIKYGLNTAPANYPDGIDGIKQVFDVIGLAEPDLFMTFVSPMQGTLAALVVETVERSYAREHAIREYLRAVAAIGGVARLQNQIQEMVSGDPQPMLCQNVVTALRRSMFKQHFRDLGQATFPQFKDFDMKSWDAVADGIFTAVEKAAEGADLSDVRQTVEQMAIVPDYTKPSDLMDSIYETTMTYLTEYVGKSTCPRQTVDEGVAEAADSAMDSVISCIASQVEDDATKDSTTRRKPELAVLPHGGQELREMWDTSVTHLSAALNAAAAGGSSSASARKVYDRIFNTSRVELESVAASITEEVWPGLVDAVQNNEVTGDALASLHADLDKLLEQVPGSIQHLLADKLLSDASRQGDSVDFGRLARVIQMDISEFEGGISQYQQKLVKGVDMTKLAAEGPLKRTLLLTSRVTREHLRQRALTGQVKETAGVTEAVTVSPQQFSGLGAPGLFVLMASLADGCKENIMQQIGKSKQDTGIVSGVLNRVCYGQYDAGWLGFYDFFGEVVGLECCDSMKGLIKTAQSIGWWWPLAGAAIMTDRPKIISRDEQGRLHSETGPSLAYRDGWKIYTNGGVRIPAYVVENPEQITVDDIESTVNAEVRRVKAEVYGWPRFLTDSGATKVAEDEDKLGHPRELYRKAPMEGEDEELVFVVVTNSTAEPDGSHNKYAIRVPPTTRTPAEGIAWSLYETEDTYDPDVET